MNNHQSTPDSRDLRALELRQQGKTLAEIADYFHVTTERVRQILLRAEANAEARAKFEEFRELCATLLQRPKIPAKILDTTIDYLNLSARAYTCLKIGHIETIGALISKTSIQLLIIKNMGKKTLDEIQAVLDEVGLSLADTPTRFYQRVLPLISPSMRYILTARGWSETGDREWKFGYDGEPMNWEEAAILEMKRDTALNIERRLW